MAQQIRINGRLVGTPETPVGGTGEVRQRVAPKKPRRHPVVIRIGEMAAAELSEEFEGADWILQAQDGLEQFLMRCIEQFHGAPPPRNMGPIESGEDYTHYARTAEQIKQDIAAEEGSVSAAPKSLPRFRQDPREVAIPESSIQDPAASLEPAPIQKKATGNGWAL